METLFGEGLAIGLILFGISIFCHFKDLKGTNGTSPISDNDKTIRQAVSDEFNKYFNRDKPEHKEGKPTAEEKSKEARESKPKSKIKKEDPGRPDESMKNEPKK